MKKLTKAVFPVAGLGTCFQQGTIASPNEIVIFVWNPSISFGR